MEWKMKNNNYKKMRVKLGLTQVTLAKKLGVKQSAVSHWETGRSIPSIKIMRAFQKLVS